MKHLHRDLESLQRRLLDLAGRVEVAIRDATLALLRNDTELARSVVAGERAIDLMEVEVEEECLKILALHQPVAGQLRLVITALKVDNDLERMGDAAESIAVRALQLARLGQEPMPDQVAPMVAAAQSMTANAMRCLVEADVALARTVLTQDAEVDELQRTLFDTLQDRMRTAPAQVESSVLLLSATRQVERIADLATNIAEDVIFLHSGDIVRHKRASLRAQDGDRGA
ncbi:MAG: phosphate signaling complex protein PhoU [Planctomycetota bacterium]